MGGSVSSSGSGGYFQVQVRSVVKEGWDPLFVLLTELRKRLQYRIQLYGRRAQYFRSLPEVVFRCHPVVKGGKPREFLGDDKARLDQLQAHWESERGAAFASVAMLNHRANRYSDAFDVFRAFVTETDVQLGISLDKAQRKELVQKAAFRLDQFRMALGAALGEWKTRYAAEETRFNTNQSLWTNWTNTQAPQMNLPAWMTCPDNILLAQSNKCPPPTSTSAPCKSAGSYSPFRRIPTHLMRTLLSANQPLY